MKRSVNGYFCILLFKKGSKIYLIYLHMKHLKSVSGTLKQLSIYRNKLLNFLKI